MRGRMDGVELVRNYHLPPKSPWLIYHSVVGKDFAPHATESATRYHIKPPGGGVCTGLDVHHQSHGSPLTYSSA